MTNRELDYKIAEKLMGWVFKKHSDGISFWSPEYLEEVKKRGGSSIVWPDLESAMLAYNGPTIPNYSEKRSQAFLILDALSYCEYTIYSPKYDSNIFAVLLVDKRTGRSYAATADTLPKAICLAALETVKSI